MELVRAKIFIRKCAKGHIPPLSSIAERVTLPAFNHECAAAVATAVIFAHSILLCSIGIYSLLRTDCDCIYIFRGDALVDIFFFFPSLDTPSKCIGF